MSALRFRMPSETLDFLNIRDLTETGPLTPTPSPEWEVDGDGLAAPTACGRTPVDPQNVTG